MPSGKYERTQETRDKMRRAQTGKKASEETRKLMRDSQIGLFLQERHPLWRGENGSKQAGNKRARRIFKVETCEKCGADPKISTIHRHHMDGNTLNNSASNIQFLCCRCHARLHAPESISKRWRK